MPWLRTCLLLALLAACREPAAPAAAADAASQADALADTLADTGADAAPDPADAATAPGPGPAGTWHLAVAGQRLTVDIRPLGAGWRAGLGYEPGGIQQYTTDTTWDPATGALSIALADARLAATVADGVLSGRWCPGNSPSGMICPYAMTGWNQTTLDAASPSRVYDLLLDGTWRARLRLTGTTGTFKIDASLTDGVADEGLQYDIAIAPGQDGKLDFAVPMPEGTWHCAGTLQGRKLSGTLQRPGMADAPWTGERAEVLSYGLAPRTDRQAWQQATRRQLQRLMMAGNPAPLTMQITRSKTDLPPQPSVNLSKHRDDDAASQPQAYRLSELTFAATLADPWGGPPLQRTAHAWLATPTTPQPPGGHPAVLALNGHYGSASNTMDPASDDYWYGDALARRGYVVLALDVGHRPLQDRSALYTDMVTGDDASLGNALHPAIRRTDADSDWEEEGERVWDAQRALDYLAALPGVDAQRLSVTGLSMGGELATWVGALDPRVAATVAAGFSPDLGVLQHKPDNHPCWRWQRGDLREYVDISDIEALIAPRRLVVETGLNDASFSMHQPPFAADKQVLRRARVAYGAEVARVRHFLHDGEHAWRTGLAAKGMATPLLEAPTQADPLGWQSDGQTQVLGQTLLDVLSGP